ncbi:hypothetical protein JCM19236_3666 [Vibrio sp. JCM 19236]|nr:hypothetical protein JCM19236_3666 [Vibrio sp. JCM 19236]
MKSHIALSFISLGVLTACGGGSGGSSSSDDGSSSSTPTVTETAEVTTLRKKTQKPARHLNWLYRMTLTTTQQISSLSM